MRIRRFEPKGGGGGGGKAIAPYSNALEVTGATRLLFLAGQTAVDERGEVVGRGDAEAQAQRAFENITLLLEEAGLSWRNVVRLLVLQTDLADRPAVNKVRARFVDKERPPTSTMAVVKSLALPDLLVEVEAVAVG